MRARLHELELDAPAFTAWTLEQMAMLAAEQHRSWLVIQAARRVVTASARDRDTVGQARALLEAVRDGVHYIPDPVGAELVQSPEVTLDQRCGDCDDMATLLVALAGAVGIEGRFVAMSERASGVYTHVYPELLTSRGWLAADATEPNRLGWAPRATRELVQEVRYAA